MLFVLVAFSFHTSAIVFLPVYYLVNTKWNKKKIFIVFGLLLIVYFNLLYFARLFATSVDRYYGYLENRFDATGNVAVIFSFLISLAVFLLIVYQDYGITDLFKNNNLRIKHSDNLDLDRRFVERVLFIMASINLSLSFLGLGTTIMGRISMYFSISNIFILPNIMSKNVRFQKLLNIPIVAFSLLYLYVTMKYRPEWATVVPYQFFF